MYLYDPSFFIESERRDGEARGFMSSIGEGRAFVAMCDDLATLDLIRQTAKAEFAKSDSLLDLFFALKPLADWSGRRAQFALIDSIAGEFDCYTINAPQILCRTSDGHIVKLGKGERDFGASSVEYYAERFSRVGTLFISLDSRLVAVAENHLPFCFSKSELKKAFDDFAENEEYEFFFVNCEIGRDKLISRAAVLDGNLDAVKSAEEELESMLGKFVPNDDMAATNALLIFNELAMNALEHGCFGVNKASKQAMIERGEYEEYVAATRSDRHIHLAFDYYRGGFLRICITDEGEGFDYIKQCLIGETQRPDELFRGRGMVMARQNSAAIFYYDGGRSVAFFVRISDRLSFEDDDLNDEKLLLTMTALFAEDDEYVLAQIDRLLKRAVRTLLLARNGEEALELYKNYNPDIVVTDVEMPKMGGLELAQAIRAIDAEVPIIVTTAHNDEDFFTKAIEAGVDKFLVKPVRFPNLRSTLSRFARGIYLQKQALVACSTALGVSPSMWQKLLRDDRALLKGAKIEVQVQSGEFYGVMKIDDKKAFLFVWNAPDGLIGAIGAILLSSIVDRWRDEDNLQSETDFFYEKVGSVYHAPLDAAFALLDFEKKEIWRRGADDSKVVKVEGGAVSIAVGAETGIRAAFEDIG